MIIRRIDSAGQVACHFDSITSIGHIKVAHVAEQVDSCLQDVGFKLAKCPWGGFHERMRSAPYQPTVRNDILITLTLIGQIDTVIDPPWIEEEIHLFGDTELAQRITTPSP